MTAVNPDVSQQAVIEATLVLLERMGLSPADLTAVPPPRKPVPTFAEYVPVVVAAAVTPGTRRAYGSYWNRIIEHWGSRRLDEPNPVGDPAVDDLRQDPCGTPPQRPGRPQRRGAPSGCAAPSPA